MHVSAFLVVLLCQNVLCKVFNRCELVRELSKKKHRIPPEDLSTWVCIARHESEFNTSAVGHLNADLSGDHGLFQISDQYWCSPPGVGEACGLNCDQLEDDDITDDVICARRIYRAHKRRTGDGFTAWAVYGPHCRGDNSAYVEGCEDQDTPTSVSTETPTKPTTPKGDTTTEKHKNKPNARPTKKKPTTTTTTTTTTVAPVVDITSEPSSTITLEELTTEESSSTPDYTGYRKFFSVNPSSTDIDPSTGREPVSVPRARQSLSRLSETSSSWNQRPTSLSASSSTEDPKTAWFNIHYDPRFLDEFP